MRYAKYALAALALGAISPVGTPPTGSAQSFPNGQSIPPGSGIVPIGGEPVRRGNGADNLFQNEVQLTLSGEAACERDVANLLSEYSHTQDEKKRSEIKTKISGLLDQQFDHQQKRRDLEVKRIEAQLSKLRDLIKKRSDSRQTIVQKRLDQVLSDADGLGWTPSSGNNAPRAGFYPSPFNNSPGGQGFGINRNSP